MTDFTGSVFGDVDVNAIDTSNPFEVKDGPGEFVSSKVEFRDDKSGNPAMVITLTDVDTIEEDTQRSGILWLTLPFIKGDGTKDGDAKAIKRNAVLLSQLGRTMTEFGIARDDWKKITPGNADAMLVGLYFKANVKTDGGGYKKFNNLTLATKDFTPKPGKAVSSDDFE